MMNGRGVSTLLEFIVWVLRRSRGHAINPIGVYTLLGFKLWVLN